MNIAFEKDKPCGACQAKNKWEHHIMTTTRPLKMLYMNLFDPIAYVTIDDNKYGLVIIDDYSRFT
jgi:hypothetical protein